MCFSINEKCFPDKDDTNKLYVDEEKSKAGS